MISFQLNHFSGDEIQKTCFLPLWYFVCSTLFVLLCSAVFYSLVLSPFVLLCSTVLVLNQFVLLSYCRLCLKTVRYQIRTHAISCPMIRNHITYRYAKPTIKFTKVMLLFLSLHLKSSTTIPGPVLCPCAFNAVLFVLRSRLEPRPWALRNLPHFNGLL